MSEVILIVDDSADILDLVSGILSDTYVLLRSLNGANAIELLKANQVDLIISDIMMPVMDGFALCETIKSNPDYSHIPVILLTSKNSLQSRIEGLEIGADAYIDKPFSPKHLKVQVANLLNNRKIVKSHFSTLPLTNFHSIANSKADVDFLEKLNKYVLSNIENAEIDVDDLASIMNMSRTTFYRKIKGISNESPNELINIARLKRAAELLSAGQYKIYEVAIMVGYKSPTHFSRSFHKQFGISATEYMEANQQRTDIRSSNLDEV
jgi:DNA-binding response OmpR family regulator